jgi:tetratricopeptide (TPR) repeat protein
MPVRGFVNTQDFVEFRALASTQGVAVEPLADDLDVALAAGKIVIGRPGGLVLSNSLQNVLRATGLRPLMFDSQLWGYDRGATYGERQANLIAAAAAAPAGKRLTPRLDLARFYIAREMYPEAKGVLDAVLSENHPAADDVAATVLRAVVEVMMNRPEAALKDLANPAVGDQHDAPLWRALAYARQGKWAQAREGFKSIEAGIATLPVELQRSALKDEMRAAIEVGDFGGAADDLNDLETIGVPHEMQPAVSVLVGRLAEGIGHRDDALGAYRTAADSWDRPAAAQGRLHETLLRYSLGDLKREDVVTDLEMLTTIWRGDDTEVEALQILARLYTEQGRYRDSFYVMRAAMAAHPNSDLTRRIEEEAASTFEALFLAGKGDALPAVDALALFYDFHELVPIGRRGDEMIRRLADRLASVDLLDQAADLLQYQVDHRLQGAARAQVATRLAVIYLVDRKPDRALATLRATRTADLADEMRNQRLLLEARAMSDLGRHDLALEVIGNVEGREAVRLRSDIQWAARRWRKAAEQIELYYGERWKEWQPLNVDERADILRAAIGFALDEDTLGLGRFREKYVAKMAQTPDARAFEIVSASLGTAGTEFRDIAHAAASVDTLEGFLRDMRARYPEASAVPAPAAPPATMPSAEHPASAPAAAGGAPTSSAAPDPRPTASTGPTPPPRAAGRTSQR